jgi:hypothetical protein
MPPKEPKKEVEVLGVVEETVPKPTTTRSRSEARGSFGGPGGSEAGGGYGGNRSEAGDDLAVWEEEQEDEHVRSLYKAEKLLDDVLYRQNM